MTLRASGVLAASVALLLLAPPVGSLSRAAAAISPPVRQRESPAAPPTAKKPPARTPSPASGPRLTVGRPAPALEIAEWLKGKPIEAFQPGTIYVIEFWATWCGPCVTGIGHLTELQREFKDKNVVIIGATARDPRNQLPEVKAMVAMRGDGMDYTVAWDASGTTYRRFMTDAALSAIPASFVIGRDGIVEYIGHPSTLDLVLPKLVDGTWSRERDLADIAEAEKAMKHVDALGKTKPAEALAAFKEVQTRWPRYAEQSLLARADLEHRSGDAEACATTLDAVEKKAMANHDLLILRGIVIRHMSRLDDPGMGERLQRVAEAACRFAGEKDSVTLRLLAKVYYGRKNLDRAIETMAKAVNLAELRLKIRLQEELDGWKAEKAKSAAR